MLFLVTTKKISQRHTTLTFFLCNYFCAICIFSHLYLIGLLICCDVYDIKAVALLESRRIRDRPMTQGEEQMLATLDKIKVYFPFFKLFYICLIVGDS